jgi:tetratricopeptide (TPR) repeat protein
LAINPEDYEAHASRGLLSTLRNDYLGSITHYRRSVDINPNYSMSRMWLGSALMKFGRVQESYEQYDIALSLDPLHPAIQINYLSSLMHMGKYDYVIDKSSRFYDTSKNPGLLKLQLLAMFHIGDFVKLFSAAQRYQFYGEDLSHAGFTIVSALLYLGEIDRANEYLERNQARMSVEMAIPLKVKAAIASRDRNALKEVLSELDQYRNDPRMKSCNLAFYHKHHGLLAWMDNENALADEHFVRAAEIFDLECTVEIKSYAETLAYRIDIAKKSERPESLTQLLALGLKAIDDASSYGRADIDVEIAKLVLMVAAQETDKAYEQMYAMQAKGWLPQASTKFSPIMDDFTLQYAQSTAVSREFHKRTQQAYNVAKEQSRALDLAGFDI